LKFQAKIQKEIAESFKNHEKLNDEKLVREVKTIAHTGPGSMIEQNILEVWMN